MDWTRCRICFTINPEQNRKSILHIKFARQLLCNKSTQKSKSLQLNNNTSIRWTTRCRPTVVPLVVQWIHSTPKKWSLSFRKGSPYTTMYCYSGFIHRVVRHDDYCEWYSQSLYWTVPVAADTTLMQTDLQNDIEDSIGCCRYWCRDVLTDRSI